MVFSNFCSQLCRRCFETIESDGFYKEFQVDFLSISGLVQKVIKSLEINSKIDKFTLKFSSGQTVKIMTQSGRPDLFADFFFQTAKKNAAGEPRSRFFQNYGDREAAKHQ